MKKGRPEIPGGLSAFSFQLSALSHSLSQLQPTLKADG